MTLSPEQVAAELFEKKKKLPAETVQDFLDGLESEFEAHPVETCKIWCALVEENADSPKLTKALAEKQIMYGQKLMKMAGYQGRMLLMDTADFCVGHGQKNLGLQLRANYIILRGASQEAAWSKAAAPEQTPCRPWQKIRNVLGLKP